MKSAKSRKSIGIAMIVFSIFMFILSIVNLAMGALQLNLTSALWTMWATIILLTFSCGLVVDGKNKAKGDLFAVAKNKKGVGIANLVFGIILMIVSGIGVIRGFFAPLDLADALIKEWCSIIIFGFSIHQIVSAKHEAIEAEENEDDDEEYYQNSQQNPVTKHYVHCPNCHRTLVAYSNSSHIKCSCGKSYKNPYYDA